MEDRKMIEALIEHAFSEMAEGFNNVGENLAVLSTETLMKMKELFDTLSTKINEEVTSRNIAQVKTDIRRKLDEVSDEALDNWLTVCHSCGAVDTKDLKSGHWTNTHEGWCLNK